MCPKITLHELGVGGDDVYEIKQKTIFSIKKNSYI